MNLVSSDVVIRQIYRDRISFVTFNLRMVSQVVLTICCYFINTRLLALIARAVSRAHVREHWSTVLQHSLSQLLHPSLPVTMLLTGTSISFRQA